MRRIPPAAAQMRRDELEPGNGLQERRDLVGPAVAANPLPAHVPAAVADGDEPEVGDLGEHGPHGRVREREVLVVAVELNALYPGGGDLLQVAGRLGVVRVDRRERDYPVSRSFAESAAAERDCAAKDTLEELRLGGYRARHRLVDAGELEAVELGRQRAIPSRPESALRLPAHPGHRPHGERVREMVGMEVDDHCRLTSSSGRRGASRSGRRPRPASPRR